MYCIYWVDNGSAKHQEITELSNALVFSDEKRKLGFRFVTMAYENPDMVGKQGAAEPSSDYHWPKRRTTALRFPK